MVTEKPIWQGKWSQTSVSVAELSALLGDYPEAIVRVRLDWSGCYYEGDQPDVIIEAFAK